MLFNFLFYFFFLPLGGARGQAKGGYAKTPQLSEDGHIDGTKQTRLKIVFEDAKHWFAFNFK